MKTLFLTTCAALAFIAALGCGGDGGGGTPQVDSELMGIYQVDRYQSSPECAELMDIEGSSRLVLYSAARDDDPERAILVGQFCSDVDNCKARASTTPQSANYAFFQGSDAEGWIGWGLPGEGGMAGDQCRVEVQTHTLTSSSNQTIRIDTEQVETIFEPTVPEGTTTAICPFADAIASINDESPCTALFLLEATFEVGL